MRAIRPNTKSGETTVAYRQRTRRGHYIEGVQHKARFRRVAVVLVIAIVIAALAIGAGFLAYRSTVGSELSLGDPDVVSVLEKPEAGEAYYTLVSVDLGSAAAPLDNGGPDVALLVRVDEAKSSISMVNIPTDLKVTLSDSQAHHLYEASKEGDAAFVEAVSKFAGVPIAHFVKFDPQDIEGLVDALGGITIDVKQVVDDPQAGDVYIPAGEQTLGGHDALVFLRAKNLKLGISDRMENQLQFAAACCVEIFKDGSAPGFTGRLDNLGKFISTDYGFDELEKMQTWLKNVTADSMTLVALPGYTNATTGIVDNEKSYFNASASDMATIVEALDAGEKPNLGNEVEPASIDASQFTIEVQNGTSIDGAASVVADELRAARFKVEKVGNAEQAIYDETLVIYKDDEGEKAAQNAIKAIGMGRAVNASYYYEFEDDILIIVGSDYKPLS